MSTHKPATNDETQIRQLIDEQINAKGAWQIIHEHCSVPFNPETSQAVLTLEP